MGDQREPRSAGFPYGSDSPDSTPTPEGDPSFRQLGHFRIVGRIGTRAWGEILNGYDDSLKRFVTIRVLSPQLAASEESVRRFHAAATAAAKISHPNVATIHFVGEDAGRHFCAIQHVEGESLADRLRRKTRLATDEALAIVGGCLSAVDALDGQGLIHPDVQPENVLLDAKAGRVVLIDFGQCRDQIGPAASVDRDLVFSSVDYASPEAARQEATDGRSDIYSLGVLLYQLLAGRLPFESDVPAAVVLFQHAHEEPDRLEEAVPDLPQPVRQLVARMMAKNAEDRHATCSEALEEIRRLHDDVKTPPADESAGRESTVAIAPPPLPEPDLPEDLERLAAGSRRRPFRDWAATMFRRHAPEFVKELQTTTQQVDGAVAEYERRRNRLVELSAEAREVAAELAGQLEKNRQAGLQVAADAAAAEGDEARHEALAEKKRCDQNMASLEVRQREHQQYLDEIRLRSAKLDANLARLRGQRDVLRARLRAAEAKGSVDSPKTSNRDRRLVASIGILTVLLLALGLMLAWKVHSTLGKQKWLRAEQEAEEQKRKTNKRERSEWLAKQPYKVFTSTSPPPIQPRTAAASLTDGLTLYLTFEEDTIERVDPYVVVKDLSGQGNHGLLSGATPVDGGRVGSAAEFDGEDDYIALPALDSHEVEDSLALTFGVWVWDSKYRKTARIVDGTCPLKTGLSLTRSAEGRSFRFTGPMDDLVAAASGVGTGKWHHVVGVWDRAKTTIYVDGQLADEQPAAPKSHYMTTGESSPDGPIWVTIGAEWAKLVDGHRTRRCHNFFQGRLDEIVMFNRALAEEEVRSLYRMGIDGLRPEPLEPAPSVAVFLEGLKGGEDRIYKRKKNKPGALARFTRLAQPAIALSKTDEQVFFARITGWVTVRQGRWDVPIDHSSLLAVENLRLPPSERGADKKVGQMPPELRAWASDLDLRLPPSERGADKKVGQMPPELRAWASDLAVSPDEKCLASCGASPVIIVWDPRSAHSVEPSELSKNEARVLEMLADDRKHLTKPTGQLTTSMRVVHSISFSPDSRLLLAGGKPDESDADSRPLSLWDVEKAALVRRFDLSGDEVDAVAYSPDGRLIAASLVDNNAVEVIDPNDGSRVHTLLGHTGPVLTMKFLPDEKGLLTGSDDRTVRLWDLKSGKEKHVLTGHTATVRCMDVTGDGRHAITGGLGGLLLLWDLEKGEAVDKFMVAWISDVLFRDGNRSAEVVLNEGSLRSVALPPLVEEPPVKAASETSSEEAGSGPEVSDDR